MLNISPIGYNGSNYHMVKKNRKVSPVGEVSKVSNKNRSNDDSNSSNFQQILEEEIEKQKIKRKLLEE